MTGITARLKRSKYRRELLNKFLAHAVLWIIAGTIGAPFFWLVTTSLKSFREIFVFPQYGFRRRCDGRTTSRPGKQRPFGQFYVNSVIVSVVGVGLSLACCVLAAYALACIPTRWNQLVFVVFLSTMMIPQEASILPNYRVISKLRWIDSYLGLIVPSIASGFGIFLMRQSFSRPQSIY